MTNPALADCCTLKLSEQSSSDVLEVKACEATLDGTCAVTVFVGALEADEPQEVCTGGTELVYQVYDNDTGTYGPGTTTLCTSGEEVSL